MSHHQQHVAVESKDILIRAQDTPNPYALKFIVNFALKEEGKATFHTIEECKDLPLISSLFDIPGIKQVYVFQNTLTVTHTGELPSSIIKDQVKSVIQTRASIHNANFVGPDETPVQYEKPDRSHLSEEVQKIEEILDRTIRPGLQADGGDIEVISFENNVLRILYQGACGGCPSSMMGTLDAIQSILSHEMNIPELQVLPI